MHFQYYVSEASLCHYLLVSLQLQCESHSDFVLLQELLPRLLWATWRWSGLYGGSWSWGVSRSWSLALYSWWIWLITSGSATLVISSSKLFTCSSSPSARKDALWTCQLANVRSSINAAVSAHARQGCVQKINIHKGIIATWCFNHV